METAMLPNLDKLTSEQLSIIVQKIREWCSCHGLLMRSPHIGPIFHHLSVTLLPSAIPKVMLDQAMQIQSDFHQLFDIITRNYDFLDQHLKRSLKDDEFSARLMGIYRQVLQEGIAQPINFILSRSDYMLHENQKDSNQQSLKQIEFNTIAAGCPGTTSIVPSLHRYVLQELGVTNKSISERIIDNNCVESFADGMITAWNMYGNDSAIIMFVITIDDYNICDQRHLEYAIKKARPSINVVRSTLAEIMDKCTLGDDKTLYYEKQEVAVAYYRSGYAPNCYPSEKEWDARLLVERSRSIKCPNIASHLAGNKKIQQVLAEPGILESLVSDKESIERMRSTFVGLYSLEGDSCKKAVDMAMKNPQSFVLKPPREGGGNNFFGEEIRTFLNSATNSNSYSSYILMDRIVPRISTNCIIKAESSTVRTEKVVSELGIFGVYISRGANEVIKNCPSGYLLRTKNVNQNESGIRSGAAGLDSVFVV